MTRRIPLTQGQTALVDDKDYDLVSRHKWYALQQGEDRWYAVTGHCAIPMHRLILDPPEGLEVDHINQNGLDNRRSNIRICTRAQNSCNRGPNKRNTTGYKGVTRHKGKYQAQIGIDGTTLYLSRHDTAREAARAYDAAAQVFHGEFAWLNFPEEAPCASTPDR